MLATDYLSHFLDHPTWPAAIVMLVFIVVIGWVVVSILKLFFHDDF